MQGTSWLKTLPLHRLSALFLLSEIHLTKIPLFPTASHRNLGTERKLFFFMLSFFNINFSLILLLLDHSSLSVPPGSCLFQSPFAPSLPSLYFFRIWNSLLGVAISHVAAWCKDTQCGPNWGEGQDNLLEWATASVNWHGFCSSWTTGDLQSAVVSVVLALVSLRGISLCRVDTPDLPLLSLGPQSWFNPLSCKNLIFLSSPFNSHLHKALHWLFTSDSDLDHVFRFLPSLYYYFL